MVGVWRGRLFLDTVNFKIWSGGLIWHPVAVAAEGDPLWPGEAPGAQEKRLPPRSSVCEGSFGLGRAQHHCQKRKEAFPARTIHPGRLQARRWQAAVLPNQTEAHFSQPRFGTNWAFLVSVCIQCPDWLRSLKQTGRRNCPLLPESSLCSAGVKQCRECGSHVLSSGNYQRSRLSLMPVTSRQHAASVNDVEILLPMKLQPF